MRCDYEARVEESAVLAPKTPRHIGWPRLDPFKVIAPRQKNMEPRLCCRRFWRGRIGLDFYFARLNMDIIELPASEEKSQRIEFCRDAIRIHRAERLAAAVSLKAVRRRRKKTFAMNRRVMSAWEMQPFGRLFFQFRAKPIALDVVS